MLFRLPPRLWEGGSVSSFCCQLLKTNIMKNNNCISFILKTLHTREVLHKVVYLFKIRSVLSCLVLDPSRNGQHMFFFLF